jgi:HemK-like putative methylase
MTGKLHDLRDNASESELNVLDFCTGTGCIALLFAALTRAHFPNACVQGVDISPAAVRLARENLKHNQRLGHLHPPSADAREGVTFTQADIFAPLPPSISQKQWDVLISNPPYVSAHGFAHDTSRSVRNYEPKLAQVPEPRSIAACRPEDVFYVRLLEIASVLKPKVVLFEVGDLRQAERVVQLAMRSLEAADSGHASAAQRIEIWRDLPDGVAEPGEVASVVVEGQQIPVRGSGHGRSVFIVRKWGQAD